jgi:hypothetical protein
MNTAKRELDRRYLLYLLLCVDFYVAGYSRHCRFPKDPKLTKSMSHGRSQFTVHTDERTQVHSAQPSLAVTNPSTNRDRHASFIIRIFMS